MNYLILRFLRGGVSGAISLMIVLGFTGAYNLQDIGQWLSTLGLAGIVGFVSGLILTVDKYLRDNTILDSAIKSGKIRVSAGVVGGDIDGN